MKYVISGLSFLLVPIVVGGFLSYFRLPKKGKDGLVHMPKAVAIIAIVCTLLFLAGAIVTAFMGEIASIGLFLFALLGVILLLGFINCRIYYDEEGFTAKNFFGVKKRYTYKEITLIQEAVYDTRVYIGKRKVVIEAFAVGKEEFLRLARSKYTKRTSVTNRDKQPKTKGDIFNGNVRHPIMYLVFYVIFSAFMLALMFVAVYLYIQDSSNGDNLLGLIFAIILGICWTVYVVIAIKVGRNPKNYSKSFIKMFFGEGHVKRY